MGDEVRALVERLLPGREVRTVVRLGGGLDHEAHEVDGELVVRRRRTGDPDERAAAVRREAALLEVVAGVSPLPVPEVVAADPEAGVLVLRELPGRPLLDRPLADPAPLVAPLAGFLRALHATPVDRVEGIAPRDATPRAEWLAEARDAYQVVAPGLPGADRQRVEAFLDAPPPAPPAVAVLCHNDLGAEHLLVDGEPPAVVVTGVIDWGDAALGDPAVDLARLHRDLGPAAAEAIRRRDDGLIGDEDLDRVAFYARCALLEDLAYGVRSGDERYRRAALANLARTFA